MLIGVDVANGSSSSLLKRFGDGSDMTRYLYLRYKKETKNRHHPIHARSISNSIMHAGFCLCIFGGLGSVTFIFAVESE
jgi:hypothetical protein